MKRCSECGEKLGLLKGYRHPAAGRDSVLCSCCFDTVYESVVKWREANLPYVGFFKNSSTNRNFQMKLKKTLTGWASAKKSAY